MENLYIDRFNSFVNSFKSLKNVKGRDISDEYIPLFEKFEAKVKELV